MYGMARWDRVLRHRTKYGDVLCKQRNSLICMMLRSTGKAEIWFINKKLLFRPPRLVRVAGRPGTVWMSDFMGGSVPNTGNNVKLTATSGFGADGVFPVRPKTAGGAFLAPQEGTPAMPRRVSRSRK